ncbi:hypothetical protein ANO11243_023420 [Dothideomycetidae sp. 11243]|nr:hypothetical protein ANO11243_023420 [fungal sp. No.11243]
MTRESNDPYLEVSALLGFAMPAHQWRSDARRPLPVILQSSPVARLPSDEAHKTNGPKVKRGWVGITSTGTVGERGAKGERTVTCKPPAGRKRQTRAACSGEFRDTRPTSWDDQRWWTALRSPRIAVIAVPYSGLPLLRHGAMFFFPVPVVDNQSLLPKEAAIHHRPKSLSVGLGIRICSSM